MLDHARRDRNWNRRTLAHRFTVTERFDVRPEIVQMGEGVPEGAPWRAEHGSEGAGERIFGPRRQESGTSAPFHGGETTNRL